MKTKSKIALIWVGYLVWMLYAIVLLTDGIKTGNTRNIMLTIGAFVCGIGALAMRHRLLLRDKSNN